MKKAKIPAAFVDLSYHKKTEATNFLKELLARDYILTEFWDDFWKGGKRIAVEALNKKKFEVIFFFQVLPEAVYLRKLNCQRFVWFPMYDAEVGKFFFNYLPYLLFNFKIISFSKNLYKRFKRLGFKCSYYQYFPKPQFKVLKREEKIRVFFWVRKNDINWPVVKKLLGKNGVNSIIIKNTPDPGCKVQLPDKEDIKKYNIRIINKWLSKKEYYKLLSSCNVFIASRKYEGIGMSFLEALSLGMVVIAPDNPVMNEYISSGFNGYLYDLHNPKEISLEDCFDIMKKTREDARGAYYQWEKNKENILIDLGKTF